MVKESKQGAVAPEKYSEVVARLQAVVEELEGGKLSLEDSLEKFAEGVQLVKKGELLLNEAEKRIEQLLSEDGQTRPLELEAASARRRRPEEGASGPGPTRAGGSGPGEDVPF